MKNLEKFIFEEMGNELKEKDYTLIYINYDGKNGFRIINSLEKLNENEKKNFYRLYIFNDDFMITVYNFGENEYKYNRINKQDFSEKIEEKKYFIDEKQQEFSKGKSKIQVRVGYCNGEKRFQYMGFIGGDK